MDAEKPHYDQLSVLSKHMCRNYTHQTVLRTLFRNNRQGFEQVFFYLLSV